MVNFDDAVKNVTERLDSDDVIVREFAVAGTRATLIYIDGISDKLLLEQGVLTPLLSAEKTAYTAEGITAQLTYGEEVKAVEGEEAAAQTVAEGDIIIVLDGAEQFFSVSLKKPEHRSVVEPPTETVIKGPREGFNEEIKTNITLVRRRLRTPNLRVKQLKMGKYSNTNVALVYIDGIADLRTVNKIEEKLNGVEIDGVVAAGYVERIIEEFSHSIFNQSGTTEKPDIIAAKLLEGRVAVMVDGTPVVVTYPYLVFEGFQDSYDYYIRNSRSSMLRVLRIFGALLAVILPGMYVALQEYHYHLLPLKFLISILNGVSGIPFSPPMEMLFVLILFEVLYQASVRMPRYVGTALSIVGAIVLGETAVNAGLLSSPTVLVIAISAIGINCVPDLVDAFSIMRLLVLLVGSVLGLFGIVLFSFVVLVYLASLQSFGTPYLAPYAPIIAADFKDGILKDDLIEMRDRPYSISTDNHRRFRREK